MVLNQRFSKQVIFNKKLIFSLLEKKQYNISLIKLVGERILFYYSIWFIILKFLLAIKECKDQF